MHKIFFGLKRAHQSTLRVTRPMLKKMGLTAARYDLLHALKGRRDGMNQARLQRCLGVTRATVSRMLLSLEELGLVTRVPDRRDRRCKVVTLTAPGRDRLQRAHRHLVESGWVQLAIDSAMAVEGQRERWYDGPCFWTMGVLDNLLNTLCHGFYDQGSLDYPWGRPGAEIEDVGGRRSKQR